MFRIDVASAAPLLPTPAAAGTQGYFTEGDPLSSTPATVVPADFLNAVMMELINAILGAGLTPSKTDFAQLQKAIPASIGGGFKFPSGLILNLGGDSHSDGTGAKPVTFGIPFTTTTYIPLVVNNTGGPPVAFHGAGARLKTGMTVYSAGSSGVAAGAGTAFFWAAIGL